MEFSHRVFQYISLPLKNARWTPAARAASTFARCGPDQVLVVADRQEDLVVEDLRAVPVGVDAAEVADVVAVGLEKPHHRVLGVEHRVLGRGAAHRERAVVADLVGARRVRCRGPLRRGCCRRTCCRPARSCPTSGTGWSRLGAALVASRTMKMTWLVPPVSISNQLGEVDARHGVSGNGPGRGHRPVAAVDESRCGVGQTVRLILRQRRRRGDGRDSCARRGRCNSPCGRCRGGSSTTACRS